MLVWINAPNGGGWPENLWENPPVKVVNIPAPFSGTPAPVAVGVAGFAGKSVELNLSNTPSLTCNISWLVVAGALTQASGKAVSQTK